MSGNYLYSPSENNFPLVATAESYRAAGTLPDDCVPVSDEIFNEYAGTPPAGKMRGPVDGMPAWVDVPELTDEQSKSIADTERVRLRAITDSEINWRQDAVDADIATDEETTALGAWKKYRVLLMRVDTAAPVWPSLPK